MNDTYHNKKNWVFINNHEKLDDALKGLQYADIIAVDTETTGLNPHTDKLRLIQIVAKDFPTIILDCFKLLPDAATALNNIFQTSAVKVFQNAKFDLQFLMSENIKVTGAIFDTMLAAQLLRTSGGPRRAGLDVLVEHYLGYELSKEEQKSDFSGELSQSQLEYASGDACVLLPLRSVMIDYLKRNNLIEAARLEFACSYAIADIEYDGIYLDIKKWNKLKDITEKQRDEALSELYPYTGYPTVQMGFFGEEVKQELNIDSNKQVLEMLKRNGINIENTSKHSLAPFKDNPIIKSLIKYRRAAKALSSFLYSMPKQINAKTGRLHPHYSQIGAWSGRMSCGGPNIQQIPREYQFRSCFVAPLGRKMVIADYSQIELRVIAQISGDQRMISAYRNGEDLHKLTAALISGKKINDITKKERQAAKAVNFGLVFGMGAAGLKAYSSETYGVDMTIDEANLFKMRFFRGYKGIEAWHKSIAKNMPSTSRTLSGRKHIYNQNSGMSGRYNTPVQGTAADILKNALGMLHLRLLGTDTKIVAVIHDEIVLECSEDKAEEIAILLKETMEEAGAEYMKDVPIIAEANVADSWAEK